MTPQERHDRACAIFTELCDASETAQRTALDAIDDDAVRTVVASMLRADAETDDPRLRAPNAHAIWSRDPSAPAPTPWPAEIDGYRVLGMLGEGGMGTVYHAEQAAPRRTVALKLIREDRLTPAALRRFQREAECLARLTHPGVATIHHVGFWQRTTEAVVPYLVMEHVDGTPLDQWLDAHDVDDRFAMLIEVATIVQAVHQAGVIHRDLKPANILVDTEGRPRLVDFGIARDGAPTATATHSTGGTPAYAAPEQLRGDATDTRADVYALGALTWRAVTGRAPIEPGERSVLGALAHAQRAPIPPLGHVDRRWRGDVEAVVARALATDPADRYATAAQFADDLIAVRAGAPVAARPLRGIEATVRTIVRHRVAAVITMLLVGSLLTGLAIVSASERRAIRAQQRSDAALSFLRDTFATAGGTGDAAAPRTMRDALLMTAAALPDALDPDAEIVVQTMLGEALLEHGAPRAAVDALQRRLALAVRTNAPAAERIVAHLDLARALRRSHALDDAARQVDAADALASGATNAALHWRIDAARTALDFESGRETEAFARWEQLLAAPPAGSDPLVVRSDFINALARHGRYADARPQLADAVAVSERRHGPLHPRTLALRSALGGVLDVLGAADDAIAMLEETLRRQRRVFDPSHPDVQAVRSNLASALASRERWDDAIPLAREVAEIESMLRGATAPSTLRAQLNLASYLHAHGETDAAHQLRLDVLAARESTLGPSHVRTMNALNALARGLHDAGALDAARPRFERLATWATDTRGLGDLHALAFASNAASFWRNTGAAPRAVALLEQVVARAEAHLPPDQWDVPYFAGQLGMALAAAGDTDRARMRLTHAAAELTRLLGADHRHTRAVQDALDALPASLDSDRTR